MKQLYPIIRRKRRSLIIEDVQPLIVAKAETGQTQIGKAETLEPAAAPLVPPTQTSNAKNSSKSKPQ